MGKTFSLFFQTVLEKVKFFSSSHDLLRLPWSQFDCGCPSLGLSDAGPSGAAETAWILCGTNWTWRRIRRGRRESGERREVWQACNCCCRQKYILIFAFRGCYYLHCKVCFKSLSICSRGKNMKFSVGTVFFTCMYCDAGPGPVSLELFASSR